MLTINNLTTDQLAAVDLMKKFLKSNEKIFTLSGVGGAGKTTILKYVIQDFDGAIFCATVSHAAKTVLSQSLKDMLNVHCFTIAKLLGLKQSISLEGEVKFLPTAKTFAGDCPAAFANLLVIDECSMIDEQIFNLIKNSSKISTKIIFLGDNCQLPPVSESEKDSITFSYTKVHLETAVRYSGPIADLGNRIRQEIKKFNNGLFIEKHLLNYWQTVELRNKYRTSKLNEKDSGYIFLNNIEEALQIATKAFKNNLDAGNFTMLAYKNDTVELLNEVIRSRVFEKNFEDLEQFVPGEILISQGGYNRIFLEGDKTTFTQILYNNQICKVLAVQEIIGPSSVPSLELTLQNIADKIPVVDWKKGKKEYFKLHNEYLNNAKSDSEQWSAYYAFKEQWGWFNYGYAQNSYKCQGQTFDEVIVFEEDILNLKKNTIKSKLQALYVCCSRARKKVYIYNKKTTVIDEFGKVHQKSAQ
jgi:ATP-dependent exoDNAse (exonuclease V) alpha subunit